MNKKSNERYKVDLPRLQELIDSHKPRQAIADAIGIDVSTITKQYNEQKGVTLDSLVRYAKYFGVTTDYLLGLTDVKEPPTSDEDKTLRTICDSTGLTRTAAEVLLYNRRRPDYLPVLGEILSNYICSSYRKRVRRILTLLQLAADDEPLTDEQRAAALNGILYVLAQFLQTAIEGSIESPY